MKTMNEINQTEPSVTAISAAFSYNTWRESFLRLTLRGASLIGGLLLAFTLPQTSAQVGAGYLAVYLILLLITFIPLPYTMRAAAFIFISYIVGLVILLTRGIAADASVFLTGFIVLTALLFDQRAAILAFAFTALTILTVGWLTLTGRYTPAAGNVPYAGWMDWLIYLLDGLTVSAVVSIAIHLLKREFDNVLRQIRQAVNILRDERAALAERLQEQTHGLARKSEQMRAASFVSRQTAAQQDFNQLLNSAVELITEHFGYYHAAIFLLNEKRERAIMQAASSEGGKQMVRDLYSVEVNANDPVALAIHEQKARAVFDSGENATAFNNPYLPSTRSQLAVPIMLRGEVIGALDIQATDSRAFTADDADLFQSLADHIAIAIENARLLNETKTILMQLDSVSISQTRQAWTERFKEKTQVYTYTPMGLRPEKPAEEEPNAIKIPIVLRGHKIGAITLARKKEETWHEYEQGLASKVASQVSLAIDNLRLLEEAQKSAQRDQILTNVSNRIRETLDMETILQSAALEFQKALNLKDAEIRLGVPESLKTAGSEFRKPQTGLLSLRNRPQRPSGKKPE
jgi:GAF domain-containing protein